MPKAIKIFIGRLLLFAALTVFAVSTASAKDLVRDYVAQYKSLVAKLSEEYGIPVSVIAAISIVESGAGKSKNCKLLNNHFGIIGKNKQKKNGIVTRFKQYENAEASYRDFCEMIARRKYYKKLKGTVKYMPWLDAMAKSGYSTQAAVWKKMISNAIKKYKLDAANN